MTVVSTSRLPVVAEMSRARWPSSPTSCSCGCLHKGSNAQAVSKTGEAAPSYLPMASASGVAPRGGRGVYGVGQARERTSRARTASCACACSMRTGLARAAAGPTEAAPHAWRPAGLGGTPVDGGLVSLGVEEVGDEVDRGVDRLARILAPRGASILRCALGGRCACGVECGWAIVLSRVAAGRRGRDLGGDRTSR